MISNNSITRNLPEVSIVMSIYNESKEYLNLAIDSILTQSYLHFEFIIIVDNPQNNKILQMLRQYRECDSRVIVIVNEENIGLAKSLNRGIKIAKGKYIIRMDADDISLPGRIEKQVWFMEKNSEFDIVCCQRRDIDMEGNDIGKGSYYIQNPQNIVRILVYGSPMTHPGLIVKKEVYNQLGGYRNFAAAQDYDFYLRATKEGFVVGMMSDVLLKYRINSNGISKSGKFKQFLYKKYALHLFNNAELVFSEENCKSFLEENGMNNSIKIENFNNSISELDKNKKKWKFVRILKGALIDENVRKYFFSALQYKRILKNILKNEDEIGER